MSAAGGGGGGRGGEGGGATAASERGRASGSLNAAQQEDGRYSGAAGVFESMETEEKDGPAKSKEGWVIFVTGVHDEACEDDVLDKFNDYGKARSIHLNLDRQTGFAKGYALIEYATRKEAELAISGMNGQQLLGKEVKVTWAFVTGAVSTSTEQRESSGGGGREKRRSGGGGR